LKLSEIKAAEKVLIHATQKRCVRASSKLLNLSPYISDDLLHTGSRLKFSKHARKLPLLPTHDPLTRLIIRHTHITNGHVGSEHVLGLIRKEFWILKGKSAVRNEVGQCLQCRRQKAPLSWQQMAPIREEQLAENQPPFANTGLDYFGPFSVKQGRAVVKRSGCIFTCLTMRAVHIEIAHSLDTDSLLSAISRFTARRGTPRSLHSDRGTNMTAADKELRSAVRSIDDERMEKALTAKRMVWHFNPPQASHRGGLWERLIRSTRTILRSLVQQQLLNDETLLTVMCEVERILNSRPLTP
jgi:hypothetical protein